VAAVDGAGVLQAPGKPTAVTSTKVRSRRSARKEYHGEKECVVSAGPDLQAAVVRWRCAVVAVHA
jgi:hypothetical protein